MDAIMCRYAEIALKGKNRILFEKKLADNIKQCIRINKIVGSVKRIRGRIVIFTSDEKALIHVKNVFGLSSISPTIIVPNDISQMIEKCIDAASPLFGTQKTFRITTRRTNKDFQPESIEISKSIGAVIHEKFNLSVSLKSPDLDIGVEIHNQTFIYTEKIHCYGGLPLGISGSVVAYVKSKNDLLSAWLFMKRGSKVVIASNKEIDISLLKKYDYGYPLELNVVADIRSLDALADKHKCRAIVVGDTLSEFDSSAYSELQRMVLAPLIAYTKEQIKEKLAEL